MAAPPAGMLTDRIWFDPYRNRLLVDDQEISLSPQAARFLELLARRPGEVVDREQLIDELWRGDYLTGDPALNRVVSETRRAVGDDPKEPHLIQTVHRRGYRLVLGTAPPAQRPDQRSDQRQRLSSVPGLLEARMWLLLLVFLLVVFAVGGVAKLILDDLIALRAM